MKIEYIRRGAATRLILIFAGWSTDARYYSGCVAEGWDTAVVHDYTDLTMPDLPPQYSTIYLFAYSLGVWAAARSGTDAAVRIAIFGTPDPISDRYGIPDAIFNGTAEGLDRKSLAKFHLRMAGDKDTYSRLCAMLPPEPDIEYLRQELLTIAAGTGSVDPREMKWHRAYISKDDRIFPFQNQADFWAASPGTETIMIDSPHAADMSAIVNHCIPAAADIGKGFAKASSTYRKHAIVQAEICQRTGEEIDRIFNNKDRHVGKLLEIGPGEGLLSDRWSQLITADSATYIDLCDMPEYGKSPAERYIKADAERWMESNTESFDLILSSSAIQWFANPLRFISELHRHLNDGGTAVITTFTEGNLNELDQLRPSPIFYHSLEEYIKAGAMQAINWERVLEFDSARDLLMHLRLTGVQPSDGKKRLKGSSPFRLTSVPTRLTYRPAILIIQK